MKRCVSSHLPPTYQAHNKLSPLLFSFNHHHLSRASPLRPTLAMIRTQSRSSTIYSDNDPLAIALRPPPFESDIERELRLKAEREAKEISDRIDEQIRLERESKKRANMQVKVSITRPGRRLVLFVSPPSPRSLRYFLIDRCLFHSFRRTAAPEAQRRDFFHNCFRT